MGEFLDFSNISETTGLVQENGLNKKNNEPKTTRCPVIL